jgi:hypothetical protein
MLRKKNMDIDNILVTHIKGILAILIVHKKNCLQSLLKKHLFFLSNKTSIQTLMQEDDRQQ